MKTSVKWGIAAAALLGVGVLAMGTASAATEEEEDPNAGKGLKDSGVRHGIRYEGCDHFDVVDPDAIEAWGIENKWKFAKWALKLDELRANPEPAIVEALTMLFPECTWPAPSTTTFGPEKMGWTEAMAMAKEAVANLDLAVSGGADGATAAAGWLLRLGLQRALGFGQGVRSRRGARRGRR
ncbi:hypothetical protein [Paraliomyxa miuraensis]|uniref:hypothetical protein n=1 Tax=Paraliomyxa miuraensis TaxID=376150 RepID=UPI00225510CE|nr:hypothetical protein [Paraliomyxa miuraensis]MCX4240192.1 hypothetical protein [Paraliomyxa miuraensis]